MCIHIYSGKALLDDVTSVQTNRLWRRSPGAPGPTCLIPKHFPSSTHTQCSQVGEFSRSEQLKGIQGLSPASQGRNATSTVVHVPYSLDSGTGVPRS